jgi:hypothetical protein
VAVLAWFLSTGRDSSSSFHKDVQKIVDEALLIIIKSEPC